MTSFCTADSCHSFFVQLMLVWIHILFYLGVLKCSNKWFLTCNLQILLSVYYWCIIHLLVCNTSFVVKHVNGHSLLLTPLPLTNEMCHGRSDTCSPAPFRRCTCMKLQILWSWHGLCTIKTFSPDKPPNKKLSFQNECWE